MIKLKTLIGIFIALIILLLLANHMIFNIASMLCDESAIKPFRYESQGLFGVMNKIETTEENRDGYARLCVRKGNPSYFSSSENINYVFEKAQEEANTKD